MKNSQKRIAILTSGGDCPGLNAAIRGVGKTAILEYGMDVLGISSGFQGLINKEYVHLSEKDLSGIMTLGGTILGTSREKPFKSDSKYALNKPELIQKNVEDLKIDCLVCIGGNGTQKTAHKLSKTGLNVIGIPKTIDNDVWGTDRSFGFDSAVQISTEALDRLHTTANSHKRIMVVEVMGHHAGWLGLYTGIAGSGDLILIPEIPYDEEVVTEYLLNRSHSGKPYSIVVVAEGIKIQKKKKEDSEKSQKKKKNSKKIRPSLKIAQMIQKNTGIETRETILGYLQRGGTPSAMDRVLATQLGAAAAELISKNKYGRMVCLKNDQIESVLLEDVAGKLKTVPQDHPLIKQSHLLGLCFGNR